MSKLLQILFPGSLLLLLLFTFLSHPPFPHNSTTTPKKIHIYKHTQIAESTCQGTLYPQLCISTVASIPNLRRMTLPEIISHTVNVTMNEVRDTASNCSSLRRKLVRKLGPYDLRALDDCLELFSFTVEELNEILSDLSTTTTSTEKYNDDLLTLLSGAMTNQYTCLDGFAYSVNNTRHLIEGRLKKISRHVSNSLAMVKKIKRKAKKTTATVTGTDREDEFAKHNRKLTEGFPTWLRRKDRRLLQAAVNATEFDLVVAKDGSGDFTTVNEAVSDAPNNSDTRFVIHIKAGVYYEYIEIGKKKTMIMLVGDGISKTVIRGNRSVGDGWTTFRSATVAVAGSDFIAKGITIENYAGPSKHQAVALRSSADLSVFYQCSFVGYQDTLYTHSLRQFYRECNIYGTVDFIFGNSAVVFQNCNILARRPNPKQSNTITAQGRDDQNQNTGISIINCKVGPATDLIPVVSQFKTYLGRPWKLYSRTVFMLSTIAGNVDPAGWLEWDGDFALDTLYYGEYKNIGPGANTGSRVTWPGYRVLNASEAGEFTVGTFIQGNEWLPDTEVPFNPNLTAT